MSMICRMLVSLALCLWVVLPAQAQLVSAHGMGSSSYARKPGPEVRAEALAKAKVGALEAYIAQTNPARATLFAGRRDEFAAQVDRYVLSSVVLSEQDDKASKTYTVTVRADINAAVLQAALTGGGAGAAPSGPRSLLTFLFMARMQDSVQSFDDKIYRRSESKQSGSDRSGRSEKTSEGESIRQSSIGTNGSISTRSMNQNDSASSSTTGGSTTRRSDAVVWKVTNAAEVNSVMTGTFSAAGYEVVEAEYVEGESGGMLSIDRIRKDFSTGSDLSPETLRNTTAGVRNAQIPLLAVGTLDVGLRDTDPVSGNVRVFVTVTGKVLNVSGRFPRTVSSVGPVQFSGLGPTESVARTNALTIAAQEASRQMVDELHVKNVK